MKIGVIFFLWEENFFEKKIKGFTNKKVTINVINKDVHKIGFIWGIKDYSQNNFSLTF